MGYRFHPTDKELVDHYLWNKILDRDSLVQAIKEVDGIFNKDPWELPRKNSKFIVYIYQFVILKILLY